MAGAPTAHPIMLPTLLPPGVARRGIHQSRLAYWRGQGFKDDGGYLQSGRKLDVPGDATLASLPAGYEYAATHGYDSRGRPIAIIGRKVRECGTGFSAFNLTKGFFTGEGLPMVLKLSAERFFVMNSGTLVTFSLNGARVQLEQNAVLTGPDATRMLRMLEELQRRHAGIWARTFSADRQKPEQDKTISPSNRRKAAERGDVDV